MRPRQHGLDHQGVDVDHAVLDQMEREHADLVVLTTVAHHLAAAGEEDEIGRAVPLLDDIESLVDLAPQGLGVQVAAQKDGLDGLSKLGQCLVGRVLHVLPGKASQDRLGLGGPQAQCRRVFDHLVVLLPDQLPVDRSGQNQLKILVGIGLAGFRPVQLETEVSGFWRGLASVVLGEAGIFGRVCANLGKPPSKYPLPLSLTPPETRKLQLEIICDFIEFLNENGAEYKLPDKLEFW